MAKILLIDDDRDLAILTKKALMKKGYEVVVFHSAHKGLEYIKLNKSDLILMDIMMPEISGAEAVKMLQKDPEFNKIPVIFLTGLISNTEEDLEKTGITIEGIHYKTLGKPYEIDELLRNVDQTLVHA